MKTNRYLIYVGAAGAVLAIALIASFGRRDGSQVAASPSPTSSANATSSTASASATATASPGASGSPTTSPAGGRYASVLGYSIETPPPWHKSSCAPVLTQQSATPGGEFFAPVSARDETGTDIGSPYTTMGITVEANPQNLGPRQWAAQDRTGQATEQIEDVVYADRPAARKTLPLTAPGTGLFKYYVANGGRMYVVDPNVRQPMDAAVQQSLIRMIASFRFLTDSELTAARAALPTALPSRTPEQVADGIAAAMTAKNVDALSAFLSACVTTAGEQAGGSFVSREKYLDDLRVAFAAGLVVNVQPRPLEGDRASGNLSVASTWQDSRGTKSRKIMLQRGENDRWAWWGTIERFQ